MTLTVDLAPEVQNELARQAAAQGRPLEACAATLLEIAAHVPKSEVHAAALLEDAAHLPAEPLPRRSGQELIDACASVRGLLTDEEVDTLFSRGPSFARPVDFE